MSSEIYEFDGSFFNDPFDILQAFQEQNFSSTPPQQNYQIAPTLPLSTSLSTSPPSNQLENLSLNQEGISVISHTQALDFCSSEVKIEESQPQSYDSYDNCFLYGGPDNAFKIMQRSYSSNCFEYSNGVAYEPKFKGLIDGPNLDSQGVIPSDHCFNHIRRVCSTGDLQSQKVRETSQRLSSSPLANETSFMEEANFKVGRYNAEERKEKILRYRAKRTQRNFNKTIKYACRKTLADNRPHIRGRFARNDEPGELPKSTNFHQYKDEYDLWMDGFQEDYGEGMIRRRQLFNTYSSMAQYQQFSFIQD